MFHFCTVLISQLFSDEPEQNEKIEVTETGEKNMDEANRDCKNVEAEEDSKLVDNESKEIKEENKKPEVRIFIIMDTK